MRRDRDQASYGTVEDVYEVTKGSALVADYGAGDPSIFVADARDFDGDSVTVSGDAGTETVGISAVDVATGEVTLGAPLANDYGVEDGFAQADPERRSRWALVRLRGDGGDPVAARVRHALFPQLKTGDRDPGMGERVVLQRESPGRWIVSDLVGAEQQIAAPTRVQQGAFIVVDDSGVTRAIFGQIGDEYGVILYDSDGVEVLRAADAEFLAQSLVIQQKDTGTTALKVQSAGPSFTANLFEAWTAGGVQAVAIATTGDVQVVGAGVGVERIGDTEKRIRVHPNLSGESRIQFSDGASVIAEIAHRDSDDAIVVRAGGADLLVIGQDGSVTVPGNLSSASGATAGRPSAAAVPIGTQFYDTDLTRPIWSDGTDWRDAAGSVV